MGRRNILLVTTDQQRYDSLGCNGGTVARTPVVDGLAASGIRFTRCHAQNVVCMPSRATIATGRYASSHGVWMNGVPLPLDTPTVVHSLRDAGYRTALVGKAHFEPYLDPSYPEHRLSIDGSFGPHRGFEHMEVATHAPVATTHYGASLLTDHPDAAAGYYRVLDSALEVNAAGGGDTGAPQVQVNPIPREWYHTDWVADRTIDWLSSLSADEDWFCWMSFPDPHHPWDPPASERGRVDWRDLDLPAAYPASAEERERVIGGKPRHWNLWYAEGVVANFEAPPAWLPASMTADQVREVNALVHVENELVDEAVGRVLACLAARGWDTDTDVFFTTDHGELQGDFGLLFKGPYHVDALMRVPMVWRPAPSAGVAPDVVDTPVGLVDLAATWCDIAGVPVPPYVEGVGLTVPHERVLTEWDSEHARGSVSLRTIHRDGWTCTVCLPGTFHDGTEGELYDLREDPLQWVNRWDDPACRSVRDELAAEVRAAFPPARSPRLAVVAPV